MQSSQIGSIFIEIIDVRVLNAICSVAYKSRQYGKTVNRPKNEDN